jgi:transposase-like protein
MMEKSLKLMSLEEPSTGQTTSCLSNNSRETVEILNMLFLPECGDLFCTLYLLNFSTNKIHKVLNVGAKIVANAIKNLMNASELTYAMHMKC